MAPLTDEDEQQEERFWKDMELAESNMVEKGMPQDDDKETLSKNRVKQGNEPEVVLNDPFDYSDGWRILHNYSTIPWSNPQQGLIRFIGGVEFRNDLSPREDHNWMMEICFKPESFHIEPNKQPEYSFSQDGLENGWELRCRQGAVELVFTTYGRYKCLHNEKCIPASVETGKWTHVLVFFDQWTYTLWCYVDGIGPVKKEVRGPFEPCYRNPRLGQNPYWPDRTFHGEVAFARVDQQSPLTLGEGLTMYAATLANARLSDLEGSKGGGERQQIAENRNMVLVNEDEMERSSKQDMDLAQWGMTLVETVKEKWRSVSLAEWDMENAPPFDPNGRRIPCGRGTVPWSNLKQGLIKFIPGAVECSADLSPRVGHNWMMEVCFKPQYFHWEDYKNTIFSQHGYESGWELRCQPGAVELVFTTEGDDCSDFSYNEKLFYSPVERDQWTHVLVFFDQPTSTLWCYADGDGPVKKRVSGTFKPCPLYPRSGQNPQWPGRTFHGEVAFSLVDQQSSRTVGEELTTYAAALANARLTALEDGESDGAVGVLLM